MSTSFSAAVSGDVTAMLKHCGRHRQPVGGKPPRLRFAQPHQLSLNGADVRRDQLLHLLARGERGQRQLRGSACVRGHVARLLERNAPSAPAPQIWPRTNQGGGTRARSAARTPARAPPGARERRRRRRIRGSAFAAARPLRRRRAHAARAWFTVAAAPAFLLALARTTPAQAHRCASGARRNCRPKTACAPPCRSRVSAAGNAARTSARAPGVRRELRLQAERPQRHAAQLLAQIRSHAARSPGARLRRGAHGGAHAHDHGVRHVRRGWRPSTAHPTLSAEDLTGWPARPFPPLSEGPLPALSWPC